MLIAPYIRLLLLGLLAILVPIADAKGGGNGSGGKGSSSKSKGSSSKGSKPKISKTVIHTNGSSHTECRDEETGEIVSCPKDNKAGVIAGIVIGSVVGVLLIGGLIFYLRRRRRNQGQTATRSLSIPFIGPAKKKEYKPIDPDPETKAEGTV